MSNNIPPGVTPTCPREELDSHGDVVRDIAGMVVHGKRAKQGSGQGSSQQMSLFDSLPPTTDQIVNLKTSVLMEIFTETASDVVADKVIERIAPDVERIKGQGEATAAKLDEVADDLKVVKKKLDALSGQGEASRPKARKSSVGKSRPGHRKPFLGGKGKSDFHGPLCDELLRLFSRSFADGDNGNVRLDVIRGAKKAFKYAANENTLLDMAKRHVGEIIPRQERIDGRWVHFWGISKAVLEAAIERRASERGGDTVAAPPAVVAAVAAAVAALEVKVDPEDPEPRVQPRQKKRRRPKPNWNSDKTVYTVQVLRRFPEVSKKRLHGWIKAGKISCNQPKGGSCRSPYKFVARVVEREIKKLLREGRKGDAR